MSDLLTNNDRRTEYCGLFTNKYIGEHVCAVGWVQRQRDLGSIIFIDLRDRSGIIQLAFDDMTESAIFDQAFRIRSEYVLCVKGFVRKRSSINKNIPTGDIEIAVDELKILSVSETPPFEITEDSEVKPELRLKHRYLDLRRPDLQRNIIERSKIVQITRKYFMENGFIDIETPNLIKPTPEGARDYLVPSRVHHGCFYALPQSPQLYKQLLMLSGFDRYFQIARCYRDEDLRVDRQPEFTQIDLEMSFITQEGVIEIIEGFVKYLFAEYKNMEINLPLPRLTYTEAMEKYGSDKPDLRFGFELIDLSDALCGCGFKVFAETIAAGGSVRAINIKNGAENFSRKEITSLTDWIKTYKAKGLAYTKLLGGEYSSSYAKFLSDDENSAIYEKTNLCEGDIIFIVADKNNIVFDSLGALRCEIARRLNIIKNDEYKMLWVTDFPLLEYSEEDKRYYSTHHPFTMPCAEDLHYLDTDPSKVRSIAYDIVINGMEAGGGSVRIHSQEIQSKIFEVLGFTKEDADKKFGFLLDAFKYGVPPHAGLAFGLDRLTALLLGLSDIRDVIAFPKVQNASELMTKCPAPADPATLTELGIALTENPEEE